jgi:hypothetical protein
VIGFQSATDPDRHWTRTSKRDVKVRTLVREGVLGIHDGCNGTGDDHALNAGLLSLHNDIQCSFDSSLAVKIVLNGKMKSNVG